MRNNGVYVRVRTTDVRAMRLENRQGFTAFVSSNLTLSANSTIEELLAGWCTLRVLSIGFAQDTNMDTGQFTGVRLASYPNPAVGAHGADGS